MSQVSSLKSPSLMRYARVQAILEQEAAFVAKMGAKSEVVYKPTGEKQLFSPEVIAVTQAIHNAGKDAHKVHKTEIIKFAIKAFRIGQPEAANNGHVEMPAGTPTPPAAPATPAVAPKPAKPAKATAKTTSKAPVKQKVQTAAAPAPEPPAKEVVEKPASAPVAESEDKDVALKKAKERLNPERPGENPAAFNAYISMYSMALTLLQLVELYDNQPGKDKRFKTLDDLAKEFNKFTSIKSAKEAQKAQS